MHFVARYTIPKIRWEKKVGPKSVHTVYNILHITCLDVACKVFFKKKYLSTEKFLEYL